MESALFRHFSSYPRAVVWGCLALIIGSSWFFIVGHDFQDFIETICRPSLNSTLTEGFVPLLGMWLAMILAMMLPSAAPMVATYLDIAEAADEKGILTVSPAILISGYVTVWGGFAVINATAQMLLKTIGYGSTFTGYIAGVLLIFAGAYQFSALKHSCLSKCRQPMPYFMAHWSDRPQRVFGMGVEQGLHCLGCCWALMLLALVAGVMNPLWMAAVSVLMILEKTVPQPRLLSQGLGLGLIFAGGIEIFTFMRNSNAIW